MILDASGYRLEETPWADQAACRGLGQPDLFFPERGGSTTEAKTVCAGCAVRFQCLDYAVRWDIGHGIWGGLSTRERSHIGRTAGPRRLAGPHGTPTRYARGCRCIGCCEAATVDKQLRIEAGR